MTAMRRYLVVGGVCRLPPEQILRLSAEQAKAREHRIGSIEPIDGHDDVLALTSEAVEFKIGEIIGLPWDIEELPRYLASILELLDPPPVATLVQTPSIGATGDDARHLEAVPAPSAQRRVRNMPRLPLPPPPDDGTGVRQI